MDEFEPRPLRWTREDYYRLCEAEWFLGRRVQLIDGELIEMAASTSPHCAAVSLTCDALQAAFGPGYWVRVHGSLDLNSWSVPGPDLAVVPGKPRDYLERTMPTTALLVVEVSETTLSYDRDAKAGLYAMHGIVDYWIVNLVQRQVEVYRDPVAYATHLRGFRSSSRTIFDPGDHVTPLAARQANVAVNDLLP
jgi:Uma2 family endonuclease